MSFTTHLLVVANQTVDSPELMAALRERAEQGSIHVTLLAPVRYGERGAVRARLDGAVARLAAAGIAAECRLGDADPVVAVQEAWNPRRYDEVIVSTLATGSSRWLRVDVPHRIARLTDCPVRHVESRVPAPPRAPASAPAREPLFESVLSLLRTSTRDRAA